MSFKVGVLIAVVIIIFAAIGVIVEYHFENKRSKDSAKNAKRVHDYAKREGARSRIELSDADTRELFGKPNHRETPKS